jgi:hypothetical protein
MNEPSPTTPFLAVLIYDEGNGRRCEEPRVYYTTHPEIAYQLAIADGKEQRYDRRGLGVARSSVKPTRGRAPKWRRTKWQRYVEPPTPPK